MSADDKITIVTNNVPRDIIHGYELTVEERKQFDYIDYSETTSWDEAEFFRYHGQLYDLGEFSANWGITKNTGLPDWLKGWDGYMSDSFFSGMLVRWPRESFGRYGEEIDTDHVIVGRFYS